MNGAWNSSEHGAKRDRAHSKKVVSKFTSDIRLANSTSTSTGSKSTVSLDSRHPEATKDDTNPSYVIYVGVNTTVAHYLSHIAKKEGTGESLYLLYRDCVCMPHFTLFDIPSHLDEEDFKAGARNNKNHDWLADGESLKWTTSPYHLDAGRFPGFEDLSAASIHAKKTKATEEETGKGCCVCM